MQLCNSGCSRRDERLADYEKGRGSLESFFVKTAPDLGLRLRDTNGLPLLPKAWSYNLRGKEFTVIVEGDASAQLHSFLTNAVGPLRARQAVSAGSTNQVEQRLYDAGGGATVSLNSGIEEDGKKYTSLVVIGYTTSFLDAAAMYRRMFKDVPAAMAHSRRQYAALDAAQASAPYLTNFVRFFPDAEVNYRHFGGGFGYDVGVDLWGRYEFRMQLPLVFDLSGEEIVEYGEPMFLVLEFSEVNSSPDGIPATSFRGEGQRRFGSLEWQKIVEASGDFGAVGYHMITNRPIPGAESRIAYRKRVELDRKRTGIR